MKYTDLVMLDLKEMDSNRHRTLTGWGNENILEMAKELAGMKIPVWIRHVLVPGLTDDKEGLLELKRFMDYLGNVEKFELLPYHTMGVLKWAELGIEYPLDGILPPTEKEIEEAEKIFR